MEGMQEAFTNARAYLFIERRRMRLSRMNVLQPDDSTTPGDDLESDCQHSRRSAPG